ncbi:MAG: PD-(D/E)XK nuclease family protein, partial [Clostridia bacterium]|nr:PD-(D/E)XK nuclease family protein [Clostridia bacterium]
MTEFIVGSSGTGKGEHIIKRIRERLGDGARKYLIVPEQQAVLWESRVCASLPASAALELEVVSFRRLADTVFRSLGGLGKTYTKEARRLITMWMAVRSVRDLLSLYSEDPGHEEKYVRTLLDTMKQLKIRGVGVTELERGASEIEGEYEGLYKKLSDLSLVCSAYSTLVEKDGMRDPDDILSSLASKLKSAPFFKDSEVFIDSFYSLTPVETEILYYIMRDARDLFITFTMKEGSCAPHFSHVEKFYKSASRLARSAKRDVIETVLDKNCRCDKADLLYLEKNLWEFAAPEFGGEGGNVKIIRCRDRYEEARAVGAEIESAVRGGMSYSDIAVVARNTETYRGILDMRLDALGIPYHTSSRNGISTSQTVTLVTSALDAVAGGFKPESVIRFTKTGLFPLSPGERANFEEYITTWNIRGRRAYFDGAEWAKNPSGYKKEFSEREASSLFDANRVKGKIADAFLPLVTLFAEGDAKMIDICRTIYDLLTSLGVYETLCSLSDILAGEGRTRDAEDLEKSFSAVVEVLDTLIAVCGDVKCGADQFSRLFALVASSFDIGAIPEGVDVVTFGDAAGIRCENIKKVIMIGCAEGEFPAPVREGGIFSDLDRTILETHGITLSDGEDVETGEELFRFWRCVTLPSESLTLTYAVEGDDGDVSASVGVRRIMKLLGVSPADFAELPLTDKVWSGASAYDFAQNGEDSARRAIELYAGKDALPPVITAPLSADSERLDGDCAGLAIGKRLSLTQTRIDKFSECPFMYCMKYVVKLGEPPSAKVESVDVGNLVHKVLEVFFTEVRGRDLPIPDDETERTVDRIIAKHVCDIMQGDVASSRQKYLFRRLRRNVLLLVRSIMAEFSESAFRPYRFELALGSGEGMPRPLEFSGENGTKVSLYGTIDRADIYEADGKVYVRVVDYKTSDKTFNPSDIQKGINLQLLIYLFTLWKGEACAFRDELTAGGRVVLPGGMIYLSMQPDSAKSDLPVKYDEAIELASGAIKRSGIVLDDPDALGAMGKENVDKYVNKKTLHYTLEELEGLYEETGAIIAGIAEEIASGRCESAPRQLTKYHPCDNCSMKPVC